MEAKWYEVHYNAIKQAQWTCIIMNPSLQSPNPSIQINLKEKLLSATGWVSSIYTKQHILP